MRKGGIIHPYSPEERKKGLYAKLTDDHVLVISADARKKGQRDIHPPITHRWPRIHLGSVEGTVSAPFEITQDSIRRSGRVPGVLVYCDDQSTLGYA